MKVIDIVNNTENKYDGNLLPYFKLIWNAPNVNMPYHNLRHMLHVMWATYNGGLYYDIDPRTLRNMLIAALMHDYNHTGRTGDDTINIEFAIRGFEENMLLEDVPYMNDIIFLIRATQFPHTEIEYSLPAFILRDADVAYTLNDSWIHIVNIGLSQELNITAEKMLKFQETFLSGMKLYTEWGKKEYSEKIKERIQEAKEMVNAIYN